MPSMWKGPPKCLVSESINHSRQRSAGVTIYRWKEFIGLNGDPDLEKQRKEAILYSYNFVTINLLVWRDLICLSCTKYLIYIIYLVSQEYDYI